MQTVFTIKIGRSVMLFQLYGDKALWQILGWILVFAGLIIMNEIGRRTVKGGILVFVAMK